MVEETTPEQDALLEEVYALQRTAYHHELNGELEAAFALKRQAQVLEESIIGSEHPYVATTLDLLAIDLYKDKQYPEAERLFRRALAIHIKTSGIVSSDVASDYEWLAFIYDDQRQWRKALNYLHQAIVIRKKCSPEKHFAMYKSLSIYADLLKVTGRKVRAAAMLKRAKVMRRKRKSAN